MKARAWGLAALLALLVGVGWLAKGMYDMGFFSSNRQELQQLLGSAGQAIADDAQWAAWTPDPNHKPRGFYLVRVLDEDGFRRLASSTGLQVTLVPDLVEAVWSLPAGVDLAQWRAPAVPAGSGLQALGAVGGSNVWLRWHEGMLYGVVLRAS